MSILRFRYGKEMPRKRKNIQTGQDKKTLKTIQVEKTQVQSNLEERFQQDNDNERISCKCNKLWAQNRLLAHIKRDKKCGSKYTEQEIENIKKISKENDHLRKVAKRREIQNDAGKKDIHNQKEALRKKDARAKIQNDAEKKKIRNQKEALMKKDARAKIQSDAENKKNHNQKEALRKKSARAKIQSDAENKKVHSQKDALRKKDARYKIQSDAENKKVHSQKDALRKKDARAKIQNDAGKKRIHNQKEVLRKKDARAKTRAKIRNDVHERLIKFRRECQYGPIFTCICCMRDLFRKTVKKVTAAYINFLNSIGMVKEYLQIDENGDLKNDLKVHGDHYICQNCCRYLQKEEMPLICAKNGLEYSPIPSCLQIENLERQMICKDLVFIKIRKLPSYARMPAINDHVINVPIDDDDIIKTVTSLPRTHLTNGLVTVGLKRDMAIKNFHKLQLIRPDKICEAITYLKDNHPSYANIDVLSLEEWRKQFFAEECDDTEITGENSEDDSSNAGQIVEDASEKSIYNFATCLIPDNPLSDVVGKNII